MDHSDSESDTHGIGKLEGNSLANAEEEAILLEDPSLSSVPDQEFQLRSGNLFGSMNIDELLNSVWAMNGQDQNQNQNGRNNIIGGNVANGVGGSFTIPTPLCNKTVHEVWAEIQGSQENNPANFIDNGVLGGTQVTLKDFLVKIGVIDGPSGIQQNIIAANTTSMNFSSNNPSLDTNNIITDQPMMDNNAGVVVVGGVLVNASNSLMFAPSEYFVGESSNGNTPINGNGSAPNIGESSTRRRMDSSSIELARERRQSAAMSRARNQAYTAQLEIEVNQLIEENARLRLILQEETENEQIQEGMNENLSRTKSLGW